MISIMFIYTQLIIHFILNIMIKNIRKYIGTLSTQKDKGINKPIVDYNQRGQYRSPLALKVADLINQFEVTHRSTFPDFQIDSAVLKCKKHGTEWVHFDCQQEKNSIGFAIKCKQVPHVVKMGIQKLLQCGSKKYPVRNPIEFMTRRSFNPQNFSYVTSDYIFYGYQTTLLHDHKNLMQVFLNMMYNPLMRESDFQQMMWRYEIRGNKLEILGDVANQIRDMSNFSENKIFDIVQRQLFGREGFNKAEQITKIKYHNLVQWYQKIFTPDNLLVISHGDIHIAKLIQNFRSITKQFKWDGAKNKDKSSQQKMGEKKQIEQSKTLRIEHLQPNIPLVLSFKIENISSSDRILLSLLSYMLFDMPSSIFMNWNTESTPYAKNYGFQGNYLNVGVTLLQKQKQITEKQLIEEEKKIREALETLYKNKILNKLIQQCLYHLQNQYFSTDGIKIITSCIDNLLQLGPSCLEESLNVKSFISKTLRNYRKDNTFEELMKKHILDNKKYVRIWGKRNPELIEDKQFEENIKLKLTLQNMKQKELEQIRNYKPSDLLQNYKILPKIDINQLQIFEEKNPEIFKINQIPIYYTHKPDGVKITLKYDVTDLEEEQVKLIPVLCSAFPYMGAKGITPEAFNNYISMYIKNLDMNFETCRTPEGMKLFLFLTIQFSDRNAQYGFNLLNNLLNDHNHENLEVLSQRIQKKGSELYNEMTENLVQIHGRHLAGTKTPYAMIEDPIFMARSTCGLASDILKVANPKLHLYQVSQQMKTISKKLLQRSRISVLFQCRKGSIKKYQKYLQIMLDPIKKDNIKLQTINDKGFTPYPCLKYFPNYADQFVFESFSVPYYQNLDQVPATLVLSTIINQNIKRFNPTGGCFLFKGSLVSFIRGSRKKVLQLEEHYKKIQEVNEAKRFIFQQFRRYTSADLFYTGVSADEARIFKQAVAMVEQKSIQSCLQKYILQDIKQAKSSILAVGPHLGSYEPLIKKGWNIERSIEDMSLKMESESTSTPQISMSKYINIY